MQGLSRFLLEYLIYLYNKTAPAQRSDEWYRLRRERIGASEIAAILGINNYKKPDVTILEKIMPSLPSKFIGAPAVWGQFFESVIREHYEFLHDNIILETGAIEKYKGHAVSPDGLGIYDGDIILYEYKTVYARPIVKTKVPNYYITQVWAGLETFKFCKYAVYVEAIIKIAPIFAMGHNPRQYKYNFPYVRNEAKYTETPLCWGAIAVYKSKTFNRQNRPGINAYELLESQTLPIDFGDMKSKAEIFESLSECYVEGNFVDVRYLYQIERDDVLMLDYFDYNQNEVIEMARDDERELLGYFKWKMVDKNEVTINRYEHFIDEIMPQIQIINEAVKCCGNVKDNEKINSVGVFTAKLKKMNDESELVQILKSNKHI